MEKQAFLWFLEREEVNSIFSMAKLQQVQAVANSQLHSRKKCLCLKKSYKNRTVFLKAGKIEIIKLSNIKGEIKQMTMGILYAESIWSFNNFNENNKEHFNTEVTYIVKLLQDSEFILLDDLAPLFINENTQFFYLKIFAIQRRRMEKRVEDYVYKDARTRIMEYIFCLLKKRGQPQDNQILIQPFLTHKELGKLTSTTRQIVTTVLNHLRKKEILTFDRNILIVKDLESLKNEIKIKKNCFSEIQKRNQSRKYKQRTNL